MQKTKQRFKLILILICLVLLMVLLGVAFILGTEGTGKIPALPTSPAATEAPADKEDPQNPIAQAAGEEKKQKLNLWNLITDALDGSKVEETEEITFGVDVAKYQGTIDWEAVAGAGMDFAMIRLGYRGLVSGEITEDSNARYNLQEAEKAGLKLGAYFFSTAITKEEAIEEADWVADFLAPYPITYPIAYNCEGFGDPENRQYTLSRRERTDIALAFLQQIEKRGYEAMFYASKNEMEENALWEVTRIEGDYKIWVAQYPEEPYPQTEKSSYSRIHQMWQFTRSGEIPGIPVGVDVDIAYFGFDGTEDARISETLPEARPDPEALMDFEETDEPVTAKDETNLRDIPSQDADSAVLDTLKKGEVARRIGISASGWSKLEFEGKIYYAVSSYLTDILEENDAPAPTEDSSIQTQFRPVNDRVTAKDVVNLRSLPSVMDPDCKVIAQLHKGDVILRTGINEDVGWSRVEYNGQILYCITSYLEVVE